MLHHLFSAQRGDWKNRNIIYASPANCSGLPKCRVLTRSHPQAYSGKAVRVALPLHVFPRITALLFSLQSGAVGEMVWARFSTQIDAAARLMKVCSELCGDARCRDVSWWWWCRDAAAPSRSPTFSLSLPFSLTLRHFSPFIFLLIKTVSPLPSSSTLFHQHPPLPFLSPTSPLPSSKILLRLEGHWQLRAWPIKPDHFWCFDIQIIIINTQKYLVVKRDYKKITFWGTNFLASSHGAGSGRQKRAHSFDCWPKNNKMLSCTFLFIVLIYLQFMFLTDVFKLE